MEKTIHKTITIFLYMISNEDIIQCITALKQISNDLDFKVRQYASVLLKFQTFCLHENYLQKKITEQDQSDLDKQIIQLEIDIQTLYEEFLQHTIELSEKLQYCEFLDFNIINILNREHFEIIRHYNNVINNFRALEKSYKNYNFSWIDFSKMERQKSQLNIAIKKTNEQLLGNSTVKLLDAYEQEKEVFQFLTNRDWEPFWD